MGLELLFGAIISLVTQGVKKYFGTSEYQTLAALLALAFMGAAIYQTFVHFGIWESLLEIGITAAGIYALLLKRFEK